MIDFPDEIREIEDAPFSAAAYWDNEGRLIVEVDASLKGKERAEAIIYAMRHKRTGWRTLIPVPLLLGWQHVAEVAESAPGKAVAIGGAGLAASVAVAVAITGAVVSGDGGVNSPVAGSTSSRVVTATVPPAVPSPTHTREHRETPAPREPKSSRRATTMPPAEVVLPSSEPPDADRIPQVMPSPRRKRPTPTPTMSQPHPTTTAAPPRPVITLRPPERSAPPVSPRIPPRPTPEKPEKPEKPIKPDKPDKKTPTPEHPPKKNLDGCGGLIHIDVDPLLDVCLLD